LFCPGILRVIGEFHAQDSVQVCDENGVEFARALINFSAEDLSTIVKGRIKGPNAIAASLGYGAMEEAAHRDNITLLVAPSAEDVEGDSDFADGEGEGQGEKHEPPLVGIAEELEGLKV
jgi:hypothetical protein